MSEAAYLVEARPITTTGGWERIQVEQQAPLCGSVVRALAEQWWQAEPPSG